MDYKQKLKALISVQSPTYSTYLMKFDCKTLQTYIKSNFKLTSSETRIYWFKELFILLQDIRDWKINPSMNQPLVVKPKDIP